MAKLPEAYREKFRKPLEEELRQSRIDYLNAGAPLCDNPDPCEECNANRRELGLPEVF